MRRKPSASHCVNRPDPEVYRPDNCVLRSGAQVLRISSVKLSVAGGLSITSEPSVSWRNATLSPSAITRSSVSASPCRRSGCVPYAWLRSMCSLLATSVFAPSRSKVSSTLRIQNAGAA